MQCLHSPTTPTSRKTTEQKITTISGVAIGLCAGPHVTDLIWRSLIVRLSGRRRVHPCQALTYMYHTASLISLTVVPAGDIGLELKLAVKHIEYQKSPCNVEGREQGYEPYSCALE